MGHRFVVNPFLIIGFAVTFTLLAAQPGRVLGETKSKSSSLTSKIRLPHLPNPIDVLSSGAKKVTSSIGSLLPGKQQESPPSRYYPPQGSKKQPEKKSVFSWSKPKSEPKKSESVSDWIGKEPLLP